MEQYVACSNHPDNSAVRLCDDCEMPFCAECLRKNSLGFYYCQNCYPVLFKKTTALDHEIPVDEKRLREIQKRIESQVKGESIDEKSTAPEYKIPADEKRLKEIQKRIDSQVKSESIDKPLSSNQTLLYILISFPLWTIILSLFTPNTSAYTPVAIILLPILAPIYLPFMLIVFGPLFLFGALFGGISGYVAGVLTKRLFQKTWLAILVGYWVFVHGTTFVLLLLYLLVFGGSGTHRFPG